MRRGELQVNKKEGVKLVSRILVLLFQNRIECQAIYSLAFFYTVKRRQLDKASLLINK
jgi:hypothetical protein